METDISEFVFISKKITEEFAKQEMPHTWDPEISPVPLTDLRYLTISHYGFDGKVYEGNVVMHKETVADLEYIFGKLFAAKFPIQSMKLVDEFDGSDDKSMKANNASGFYARYVANTTRLSNHAFGCSIDINPLLNPQKFINPETEEEFCDPEEGRDFLVKRSKDVPGMITKDSLICMLFKECGWEWGGECFKHRADQKEDLHHFQKIIEGVNKTTN